MEKLIKLRFAAHFAIILMLTGRITKDNLRIDQYNSLLV